MIYYKAHNKIPNKISKAFTLIELLVVISIIALLMAVLMPALGKARRQAQMAVCMVNEKQIMNAHSLYQADNDGWIIAGCKRPWEMWSTIFHDVYKLEYDFFQCPGDKIRRVPPEEHPRILSGYADGESSYPIYPRSYSFNMFVNGGSVMGFPHNQDQINRMNPDVPMIDKKGKSFPDFSEGYGFPCRLSKVESPTRTAIHDEFANEYAVTDWHWSWQQMFTTLQEAIPHKTASNIAYLDGHIEKLTLKERLADPYNYRTNEGFMLWVRKVKK
jgi:prepilin-type N-terminal cleavage/methylation domain-containing protein/prepilin-type processing-associated H-X9-DG protein